MLTIKLRWKRKKTKQAIRRERENRRRKRWMKKNIERKGKNER